MARPVTVLAAVLAAILAAGRPAAAAPPSRAFADFLYDEGEFFRAATEYLRAIAGAPEAPEAAELRYRVALCSARAGRHAEAAEKALRVAATAPSPELAARSRLLAAASRFREGAYGLSLGLCARALSAEEPGPYGDRFRYLGGLNRAHRGEWEAARESFESVGAGGPLAPSAEGLARLAKDSAGRSASSPALTGLLSAAVPGLGQTACGFPADGLSALLLTASSAAALAAGVARDRGALAAAGAVGLAVFYPANVYGGANAARRQARRTHAERLRRAAELNALRFE